MCITIQCSPKFQGENSWCFIAYNKYGVEINISSLSAVSFIYVEFGVWLPFVLMWLMCEFFKNRFADNKWQSLPLFPVLSILSPFLEAISSCAYSYVIVGYFFLLCFASAGLANTQIWVPPNTSLEKNKCAARQPMGEMHRLNSGKSFRCTV